MLTQVVEPVAEPPVDLAGAGQQPGIGQRRQGEQQPGQRVPGAGGERCHGAFAQQPEPGQRPLAVPRHRIRQHRQRAARLLSRRLLSGLPGGRCFILRGRLRGAQHAAHRCF